MKHDYKLDIKSNLYAQIMYSGCRQFNHGFSLSKEEFDKLSYKFGDIFLINVINELNEIIEVAYFKLIKKEFYEKASKPNNCKIFLEYTGEREIKF